MQAQREFEMRRRGLAPMPGGSGSGALGSCVQLCVDLRQCKAHAVLLFGILAFGGLIVYHSGTVAPAPPAPRFERAGLNAGAGSGKAAGLGGVLVEATKKIQEEMAAQLLRTAQNAAASNLAHKALSEERAQRERHRVTAILVFRDTPGTNLRLALRSVGKRSFIREILLVHDLGPADAPSLPEEWKEAPSAVYGKPVKYLARRGSRRELLKFDACAFDSDPRNEVCYYQSPTRDSSQYLESLYASFLRAPKLLHTSVGATTLYSDQQMTFREDAFGIDAGFAYLKAGAFFRRSFAKDFVSDPLVAASDFDKMPDLEAAADEYFSLWLNRPHCELANDIMPYKREIGEPVRYERNAFARRKVLKKAHLAAMKKLLSSALLGKMTSPFRLFKPAISAKTGAPASGQGTKTPAVGGGVDMARGDGQTGGGNARRRLLQQRRGASPAAATVIPQQNSGSDSAPLRGPVDGNAMRQGGATVINGGDKTARTSVKKSNWDKTKDRLAAANAPAQADAAALTRPDGYSSCYDDRCTLISNVGPVEEGSKPMNAVQMTTQLSVLLDREEAGPGCEAFRAHQYHFAVDADPNTQWVASSNTTSEGDYFGLDMLRLRKDLKNISVTVAHTFQQDLVLEVSMRGNSWYRLGRGVSPALTVRKTGRGNWVLGDTSVPITEYRYDVAAALKTSWNNAFGEAKKRASSAKTGNTSGRTGMAAVSGALSGIKAAATSAAATGDGTDLPPLYIRYFRFRYDRPRDLEEPFVVFNLHFGVGEAADDREDLESEEETEDADPSAKASAADADAGMRVAPLPQLPYRSRQEGSTAGLVGARGRDVAAAGRGGKSSAGLVGAGLSAGQESVSRSAQGNRATHMD